MAHLKDFVSDFCEILSVSDPFYEIITKITELTKRFSFFFVFSFFFGITFIVIFHSENYENFEIYENISVMLLSFLSVSVINHPASVMPNIGIVLQKITEMTEKTEISVLRL